MEFTVRREDLVRGLYLVQGVVERRNTVPILSNVLIEPAGEGIALTATDMEVGLRGLVTAEVKKKGAVTLNARKLYEITREVTAEEVVLKSLQAGWVEVLAGRSKFKIVSLDEAEDPEVTMVVSPKDVRLILRSVSFFMRLVEGDFPDYRQVIPGAPRVQARVKREDLLSALRRMSLLASERSHGVKLHLERGKLELWASNPDQGEASEEVDVQYTGEPLTIGFNARYLLDVLAVHAEGDVMELGFTDEVGPGAARGSPDPDYTYVVMPMRL